MAAALAKKKQQHPTPSSQCRRSNRNISDNDSNNNGHSQQPPNTTLPQAVGVTRIRQPDEPGPFRNELLRHRVGSSLSVLAPGSLVTTTAWRGDAAWVAEGLSRLPYRASCGATLLATSKTAFATTVCRNEPGAWTSPALSAVFVSRFARKRRRAGGPVAQEPGIGLDVAVATREQMKAWASTSNAESSSAAAEPSSGSEPTERRSAAEAI